MIRRPALNQYIPGRRSLKECTRYWSSSTQYASGDQLLCYLADGWGLESRVEVERYVFGPGRWTLIYRFGLRKEKNRLLMPVISSPFVVDLLVDNQDFLELVTVRPLYRIRLQTIPQKTTGQSVSSPVRT